MSEVKLNILDVNRVISGTVHGSVADAAVAALSAEPESIEELQDALARFIKPIDDVAPFSGFRQRIDAEPWDAGIVFIDLPGRIVAAESTYSAPAASGRIVYHDGHTATNVKLPYWLPDDWLFLRSIAEYDEVRERRRAERAAVQPFDAREVLYGGVLEFIVEQCVAAREAGAADPVREVHARWLMTPRADLRGQSPREVLLAKVEFIDADLQSREAQWSFLGEPAPCLPPDCMAYRFAGFGPHEVVLYYELVRLLVTECWQRVSREAHVAPAAEAARLAQIKSDWMESPKPEDGRSPAYMLECERRRMPLTDGEALEDDDCPLCRAMASGKFGPMFCHLDGSDMDEDFAFSFFLTREEWEEEQEILGRDAEELNEWLRQNQPAGPASP